MELPIIIVFVVGYLAIAFEHPLKINKTASALLTGVICWTLFMISQSSESLLASEQYRTFLANYPEEGSSLASEIHRNFVSASLQHHLGSIAEILFFLMGAMTIVELIDAHHGFRFITSRIRTKNPRKLLWIICIVAFILSAILDNLTTTIVMVSLIRKLVYDRETRLFFIGMIVIAANAGGAWTPMGDVTTTMLWIGGQITTFNIMKVLLLPSVMCLVVPLVFVTLRMKGGLGDLSDKPGHDVPVGGGKLMLILGIGVMLGVPFFKLVTGMPPYIGMMAGLGLLWIVSELIHPELDEAIRKNYTAAGALSRIDVPSILFFFGILLAVGALESMTILEHLADALTRSIGDQRIIISIIGVLSAIIDNVPLVAACMGMYPLDAYPTDHFIWEFLAYCAGTGGSILIIGSAAGVAAMGMEKIDFIWYLKKITLLALMGYVSGALTYLIFQGRITL